MTRHWRKLCHEDHFDLYSSGYIITVINENEMDVTCSTHIGEEQCMQTSVGKPEGKRPLGGPRHRWEDNIKCALNEI